MSSVLTSRGSGLKGVNGFGDVSGVRDINISMMCSFRGVSFSGGIFSLMSRLGGASYATRVNTSEDLVWAVLEV